jgi:hypothetical protein
LEYIEKREERVSKRTPPDDKRETYSKEKRDSIGNEKPNGRLEYGREKGGPGYVIKIPERQESK